MVISFIELRISSLSPKKIIRNRVYQWSIVDAAIEKVIKDGGEILLTVCTEDTTNIGIYSEKDKIWIMALPGKYILIVFPHNSYGESPNKRVWESDAEVDCLDTFYFNDIAYNPKQICRDAGVAKRILEDFFHAYEITEEIKRLTVFKEKL